MENKWIADRGYGTGMALAFQGDKDFVRRSVNFAYNYLIDPKAHVREQHENFVVVNTSMEALREAFKKEGYCKRMQQLHRQMRVNQEENYPADFEERINAYVRATLSGDTSVEDPRPDTHVETEDMVVMANAYAEIHADEQIATLGFEDFMRDVSKAGVGAHEVMDFEKAS